MTFLLLARAGRLTTRVQQKEHGKTQMGRLITRYTPATCKQQLTQRREHTHS